MPREDGYSLIHIFAPSTTGMSVRPVRWRSRPTGDVKNRARSLSAGYTCTFRSQSIQPKLRQSLQTWCDALPRPKVYGRTAAVTLRHEKSSSNATRLRASAAVDRVVSPWRRVIAKTIVGTFETVAETGVITLRVDNARGAAGYDRAAVGRRGIDHVEVDVPTHQCDPIWSMRG
jgi:hypothetical protein